MAQISGSVYFQRLDADGIQELQVFKNAQRKKFKFTFDALDPSVAIIEWNSPKDLGLLVGLVSRVQIPMSF